MNSQHAEAYGSDSQTRIVATQTRITRLEATEVRLQKLNIHLANLALAEKPKQLKLIKAARDYVENKIKPEPVQGISGMLRVIDNELQSMREGILANKVTMSDLVLISGVRAITEIKELKAVAEARLKRLNEAAIANTGDDSETEINQAREALAEIPGFGDKEFMVRRVPVAFTSTNSKETKFSKVGYIDVQKLDSLGFKAGTIGGYTVVKKQLCIGINPRMLYTEVEVKDEDGNTVFEADGTTPKTQMKRRMVKIKKQVQKGGKPVKVEKRRERTAHDEALHIMSMMEGKTGLVYTMITDVPTSFKGGTWFWVMPSTDVKRFARAFPGGRIDVPKWGLAGASSETSEKPPAQKPVFIPPQMRPGYKAQ